MKFMDNLCVSPIKGNLKSEKVYGGYRKGLFVIESTVDETDGQNSIDSKSDVDEGN
jgi:hypothetical protein